ncbi:MAG: sulfite exporter TauE/SafE family protein [Chloroflexota bacterium]|nr:sulfite exporter TauE/SafE family protein [Chloroflexota bacterium]
MTSVILAISAFIAFIISTIAGGGGALILVPITSFLLGAQAVAPVVSLGTMISRPVRLAIFWDEIEWDVVKYYLPGGVVGALIGSYLFANFSVEWLQIIVALFLISTVFQYRFGEEKRSFEMHDRYFLPLGFLVSFFSALIGTTGPVLNPFYLNSGLVKGEMIGTKTANSFFVGLVKIGSYTFFGALHGKLWLYGIVIGIAASVASYLGKQILGEIKEITFRRAVILIMVVSGVVMLYRQLSGGLPL